VAVIKRAAALGQLKRPDEALAAPFISVADKFCDSEKWTEAVAVLDQGLQAVDGEAAANLHKWLVQVHNRWAQTQRKRGDYEGAIVALAALYKKTGDKEDARGAVEYFTQESLAELDRSGGPQAAAKLLARLQSEFASVEYLKEAGALCARRGVEKLLSAKKFADAVAAIDRYRPLLADGAARDEVGGHVFDAWGRELVRKKDWQQAVKVYGDGLQQFPGSDLLKSNVVVAWDSWAAESMKNKEWREAIRIYELALKTLGDNPHLRQNLEFCRSKLK
jgi:tetratricopeptide (TPR) repeat protein